MDVRMPGMDGLTCTTLIARQDPNARVLIVTAGCTTEQEARAAGARGFVEKPFEIHQLRDAFQAVAA
jgi:DNA-binding NarL/FixJ family response regulator